MFDELVGRREGKGRDGIDGKEAKVEGGLGERRVNRGRMGGGRREKHDDGRRERRLKRRGRERAEGSQRGDHGGMVRGCMIWSEDRQCAQTRGTETGGVREGGPCPCCLGVVVKVKRVTKGEGHGLGTDRRLAKETGQLVREDRDRENSLEIDRLLTCLHTTFRRTWPTRQ